jgi:peptidoglycan/xylan/chitin deacetylase (PgdA/CDA1 family)
MLMGLILFLATELQAGEAFPALKVLPWNGHTAATSLTFDDGDPSHLDVAVPELNERKMRGTFFLIANKIDRKDEWRGVLKAGHEIANHTLDHKHASELTAKDANAQVVGARNVLQKEFGVEVRTFAYPFVEITPDLRKGVTQTSLLARGGGDRLVPLSGEIDWWNIPAYSTMTDHPFRTYQKWIDKDLMARGWLVWIIHGLEGTPWGWQPISRKMFAQILDHLLSKDIWVGTFLEVGSYLRAQKIFEKSALQVSGKEETLTWNVPDHFPSNVILKVRMRKKSRKVELWQGKTRIEPDAQGNYAIPFNAGRLTVL